MKKITITLTLILAAICAKATIDPIRHTDSTSLVAIYYNTGGAGWINKSGWLTSNLENWYGITVSNNRVIGINLPENNLVGTVPLGSLTQLTYIDIHLNLGVTISDYSSYGQLQSINLSQTNCGMAENIGNLVNLTYLNLWGNGISHVGPVIGGSSDLPAGFANLTSLQVLGLGGNHFTGTLAPIANLTNLTWLEINDNELTGSIPASLGNMTQLTAIGLSNNNLTGTIPPTLGSLTHLTILWIAANQLTGPIPAEIGNLTLLTTLALNSNDLTGPIPVSLGNLSSAQEIWINDNKLTGSIPVELGNLTQIKKLDIGANLLTGTVPIELNNLVNLQHFSLCTNLLTGTLPANFLTDSDQLQVLYLCNNSFTGAVPISALSSPDLNYANLVSGGYTDLPDIHLLPVFSKPTGKVEVERNLLTFEDIEPNRNIPISKFTFVPQNEKTFAPYIVTDGSWGASLVSVGGTANHYQWQLNGTNIPGANIQLYYVDVMTPGDYGLYTIVVTNALVPSLTIKRHIAVTGNGAQTITFPALDAQIYGNDPFKLPATASSGLSITYVSSNTSVASVRGSVLTIEGAGSCTITAMQAGNSNFIAASDEIQPLTVGKASQSVSPGLAGLPRLTGEVFDPRSSSSSQLPVSYSSSATSVALTNGTAPEIQAISAGVATITALAAGNNNFFPASASVALTVVDNKSPYTLLGQHADPVAQISFGIIGLEVDAAGKIYIPNPSSDQVIILNPDGSFNKVIGPEVVGLGVSGAVGALQVPTDVALDAAGNLYVLERSAGRISVFNPAGTLLRTIGSRGTASGQLLGASGLAVDGNGKVYVMETFYSRVSVFNADGSFNMSFGSDGSENGEFSSARGIDVDNGGNIIVSDQANNRIQVFANDGTFLFTFGSEGPGDGTFSLTKHIKVDGAGNIFVADDGNALIQKFNNAGVFQSSFAWPGGVGGVSGISVDGSGNIYASNYNTDEVIKFSPAGTVLKVFTPIPTSGNQLYAPRGIANGSAGGYVSTGANEIKFYDLNGVYVRNIGSPGSGDGQLDLPGGMDVDSNLNLYVADQNNGRIQVFDNNGAFVRKFGMGTLSEPYGLTLGPDGVYVTDTGNDAVYIFSLTGDLLSSFGSTGDTHGQFDDPHGVAVDADGNIYVADFVNQRIEIFNSNHDYQRTVGEHGFGAGQFMGPTDVALDSQNRIYALDWYNHNLQIFENDGTYVSTTGSRGASSNSFNNPSKIAVVNNGSTILITDRGNNALKVFGVSMASMTVNGNALLSGGTQGFGDVSVQASSATVTFTIESSGNGPVHFNGNPKASITGANASDFTVHFSSLVSPLWPGNNTTLTVTFNPSAAGVRMAQLHIPNTGMEGVFNLQGTGVTTLAQHLVFNSLTPYIEGDPEINLPPVASSGLPVIYTSSNTAVATVVGNVLSFVGPGTSTITATQPGDNDYGAANESTQELIVTPNSPYAFTYRTEWGGQVGWSFSRPDGIAVDPTTTLIYVADRYNHRIRVLTNDYELVKDIGSFGSEFGKFNGPTDVHIFDGKLFVADQFNHRIQILDVEGNFIKSIGTPGSDPGQFDTPSGVTTDAQGMIYVTDAFNHRVQVLTPTGGFVRSFGEYGEVPGKFMAPNDVVVDNEGNIFVADQGNGRVQVFDNEGNFIRSFGSVGANDGQFKRSEGVHEPYGIVWLGGGPLRIALDDAGNVYCTDRAGHRIQKFDALGNFVSVVGSPATSQEPGQLSSPQGIAFDSEGNLLTTEMGIPRIQRFSNTGVYQNSTMGFTEPTADKLNAGTGVAIGPGTNLYASDADGTKLFDRKGNFISSVSSGGLLGSDNEGNAYVRGPSYTSVKVFDSQGSFVREIVLSTEGDPVYISPLMVAVDSDGITYVLASEVELTNYTYQNRVFVYDESGDLITSFGPSGGSGNFTYGIAVDGSSNLYITDNLGVAVFENDGTFIRKFGSLGKNAGQFSAPAGIVIDPLGRIAVVDQGNRRIQIFTNDGTFLFAQGSLGGTPGQFQSPGLIALDATGSNAYVLDQGRIKAFGIPEINIKAAASSISSGGLKDFNNVNMLSESVVTFNIENLGSAPMTFSGASTVAISGANASDFIIDQSGIGSNVEDGEVASFTVVFKPTLSGLREAQLSIMSNDADEGEYIINLQGTGVKVDQAITFVTLPTKVYGSADFSPGATTTSLLPITYTSSDVSVATITGNMVTVLVPGTTTITASQAGDVNYNAATNVSQLFTVNKAPQTITFDAIAGKTFGDGPFTVTATSTAGLVLSFASDNTSVATVSGNTVTIVGGGTANITASQVGDANYVAAPPTAQSLTVAQASQTITFAAIPGKTFGDAAFAVSPSSDSGLPVTLMSDNIEVATVSGNTITIVGGGSANIAATQAGDGNYLAASAVIQALVVAKATQSVTFPALDAMTVSDALDIPGTSSSGLTVDFSAASDKVIITNHNHAVAQKPGKVTIKADQAGNTNYSGAATQEQTICVNPPKPTIGENNANPESPILTSSSIEGNQWYLNAEAINGQTNQTLTVATSGTFTVKVTVDDDCVSAISEGKEYVVTGLLGAETGSSMLAYPNPASDRITISWGAAGHDEKTIVIYDALGRRVESKTFSNEEITFDVSTWTPGNYMVTGIAGAKHQQIRFVRK